NDSMSIGYIRKFKHIRELLAGTFPFRCPYLSCAKQKIIEDSFDDGASMNNKGFMVQGLKDRRQGYVLVDLNKQFQVLQSVGNILHQSSQPGCCYSWHRLEESF